MKTSTKPIMWLLAFMVAAASALAADVDCRAGARTPIPPHYKADSTVIFRYDVATHRLVREGFAPSLQPYLSTDARDAVAGSYGVIVTRDDDAIVEPVLVGTNASGAMVFAMPFSRTIDAVSVMLVGLRDLPDIAEKSSSFTLDGRQAFGVDATRIQAEGCDYVHHEFLTGPRYRVLCVECIECSSGSFCGDWYYC